MDIINLSELDPSWCWLKDEFKHKDHCWHHYSSAKSALPNWLPKKQSFARMISAWQAVNHAKNQPSLLVSHGPRPAYYGSRAAQLLASSLPHLVYSFNFTDLPTGYQRRSMAKAYQQPDRFVVYSTLEKKLYAQYFDIAPECIDMLHWSVHAPSVPTHEAPIVQGDYICALGSQGRDYGTLFEAIRLLKHIHLVVVANAESLQHLPIPDNVKVLTHIPLAQAHNILTHSRFMIVPLRDSQVPCGHVTIVSGMFFKKAMIVTNSEGVHDYVQDNHTGILFEPKEVADLARKIEQLWNDHVQAERLAQSGYAFAQKNCTEQSVIHYFSNYLNQLERR